MKFARTTLLILLVLSASEFAIGQAKSRSNKLLRVALSEFKLVASGIRYQGDRCYPDNITDEVYLDYAGKDISPEIIRIGNEKFFESHRFYRHGRGDGLAVENFSARTCRIYRMFGIYKSSSKSNYDRPTPDATRGLFRVGNSLWMGSNGVGAVVFDLETRTWSRYDLKSDAVPGDHLALNYADDAYVFVTRGEFPDALLHIFSIQRNKWVRLDAVSTKLVSEYGRSSGMVQVPVDHALHARQTHIPIDWTFMGVTVIDKCRSYLFTKHFTNSRTVFEIDKTDLGSVFK